jgi:hypothetical protein
MPNPHLSPYCYFSIEVAGHTTIAIQLRRLPVNNTTGALAQMQRVFAPELSFQTSNFNLRYAPYLELMDPQKDLLLEVERHDKS